jgi:hypothetical protein
MRALTNSVGKLPSNVSCNEDAFFQLNREYKGIAAHTDKAK